jgi:hypothetical protein
MAVKVKNQRRSLSSLLFKTALFIGLTVAFAIIIPILIVFSPFVMASITLGALTEVSDNKGRSSKGNESNKDQWNDFVNSMNKWSNEK